jgi:CBS domain-containing protein
MKVGEIMTRDVETAAPSDTIQTAAKMMSDLDVGVLPVSESNLLVGIITDRDITIRAVAAGKSPAETRVGEVMTERVDYCFEDETEQQVAQQMAALQIRRLPVVNREKQLIGIVSLGDLATVAEDLDAAVYSLRGISNPSAVSRLNDDTDEQPAR